MLQFFQCEDRQQQIEPSVSADTWPFVGLNVHMAPSKSTLLSSPVITWNWPSENQ